MKVANESFKFADEVAEMKCVPLSKLASLPARNAAGYDLVAVSEGIVEPQGSLVVALGIALEMPKGWYGRIASRSGLAVRNQLSVGAGVVDPDYRGEVKVLLF